MTTEARPLRICLLIGTFHPVVGGGETHARLLSVALRAQGHEVTVLTRRVARHLPVHDTVDGVPVHRVGPAGFRRWGKYLMIPAVLRELWRMRAACDVVLVCGLRVLGVCGVFAQHVGLRCVLRAEACGEMSGGFVYDRPDRAPTGLLGQVIAARNRILLHADRFVAISPVVAAEFAAAGVPSAAVARIPNAVDGGRFTPLAATESRNELRGRLGLPPDGFIFAYAGKLNRGKGLRELLLAWEAIVRESQAQLVLIGGGGQHATSCESELRSYTAARGMAARVTFTGYVQNVPDYLRAADAFIFPSEHEAFGLAPLEAALCGLPVITTPVGVLGDVFGAGRGQLVRVGDVAALADAMRAVLRAPDGARQAAAGARDRVRVSFAPDAVARRYAELFAACVRGGVPGDGEVRP